MTMVNVTPAAYFATQRRHYFNGKSLTWDQYYKTFFVIDNARKCYKIRGTRKACRYKFDTLKQVITMTR